MKHYIIDGNNLIGKISFIKQLQKKDKQGSREKLSNMIDNYFSTRKAKVTLHYDGFQQQPIKPENFKIIYSGNKTADDKIKNQIESSTNRKNIIVVTSDNNLIEFARVCSCDVVKSEEFARLMLATKDKDEDKRIKKMENEIDEFKKLFGIKNN